jgi:allantoate deiminase
MSAKIRIDPAMVERHVMELARYGAHGETGVWRTVYSPEWVAAQDRVAAWCEEAGLRVRRDAVGNVWGRLAGSEVGKAIVSGSHIDSQRPGGRYDGALGVIAALLAVRALKERYGAPRRTLEVVSLCEEEGSRFPSTNFWGSRAITGRIAPEVPDQLRSYEGETMSEVMRSIGLDPARIPEARRDDVEAFVELHIEQGPILEQEGLPVGIVDGFPAFRHYLVEVVGRSDHAGAMPMDLRRDPMPGAAEMISRAIETATRMGRPAVTTVGRVLVDPNFPAIVPEKVSFTIDARHPDPATLARLCAEHEAMVESVAGRRGLQASWRITQEHPASPADPELVRVFAAAAREQGIPARTMPSGAVHDSQRMAQIARVAMIFVQSKDGRSHTPAEYTAPEHAAAGIDVLAAGLHKLAY